MIEINQDKPTQPEYLALRSLCKKLVDCVEHIIQTAMESRQTEYTVPYETINEETGINVEFNDAILTAVHEMLLERLELSEIEALETAFHLEVFQQQNSRAEERSLPRLRELLGCEWKDLHLIHDRSIKFRQPLLNCQTPPSLNPGKLPGRMFSMQRLSRSIPAYMVCRWKLPE